MSLYRETFDMKNMLEECGPLPPDEKTETLLVIYPRTSGPCTLTDPVLKCSQPPLPRSNLTIRLRFTGRPRGLR